MPNSPAVKGYQVQWGFGQNNPVTIRSEILGGGLKAAHSRVMSQGATGTRQRLHETTGDGKIVVAGDVEVRPTYTGLAGLLPYIMGGTKTGSSNPFTYPYADVNQNYAVGQQGFYTTTDLGTKVYTHTGVNIAKAVFSCQQGMDMKCVLSLVAQTETVGNSGTFPSITLPTDAPFMWSTAVLTLNGTARSMKDWTLTIDNHPDTDRFMNSQTATQFPFYDFGVELEATLPATTDEQDLYNVGLNADVSGSLVLTDTDAVSGPGNAAAHTLTFTFGKLDWASETPVMTRREEEVMNRVRFVSRKQIQGSSVDSLSITM